MSESASKALIRKLEGRITELEEANRGLKAIIVTDVAKDQATQLRLDEHAALVRMAGRAARLGGWTLHLPERTLSWSDEICAIHEVPAGSTPTLEEALQYYPPETRATVAARVDACAKDGVPFDFELQIITAKGRWVWVRAIGEAVRDNAGDIILLQGAFQDISEGKKTLARLTQAASTVTTTLESITDGFLTLDREWRFTYMNSEAERLMQRSRSELLGRIIWDEFKEAQGSRFDIEYHAALRENKTVSFEEYYPPLKKWAEVRAYPTPEGLTVYLRDVTQRHKDQEQLTLLEACISRLNDVVLITDAVLDEPGPRILFVNDAFERLTGFTRAEIVGKTPRVLQGKGTDRAELDRIRAAIRNREPVRSELVNSSKSGTEYWIELDMAPVFSAAGVATHFVAVERDITERKRAEEEAREEGITLAGIVAALQEVATADLSVQGVMTVMAKRAQALTGATGGIVELVEGDEMVYRAASGTPADKVGLRLPRTGSLSGLAVQNATVLVCADSETDDRVDRAACRKVGVRSMVVAPLRDGHEIIGVLKVMSDRKDAFKPRTVNNLLILVESLGAVIQRQRASEQLRSSEAQYRLLFSSNPHPMWAYDLKTLRIMAVNDAAIRHYGYSEEEFLAMTIRQLRPESDLAQFDNLLARLELKEKTFGRWQHKRKDGSIIDVEVSADGVELDGRPVRLVLSHDVTERLRSDRELARTNRALRMLGRCNEALIRAESESGLLTAVCQIAVEVGGARMAWVGYAADDARKSIVPQAHSGAEEGYLAEARLTWAESDPLGNGPGGQTIRSGEPVVMADFAKFQEFGPWLKNAQSRGYNSVICLPLKDRDRTFGIIAIYSTEVRDVPPDELGLLREFADDLAFGIVNMRIRADRQGAQEKIAEQAALLDKATDAIFVRDLDHRISYWNKSAERIYGWSAEEVIGKSAYDLFHQWNGEDFKRATESVLATGEWYGESQKPAKDGRRLTFEERWTLVRDDHGNPKAILAINTDITERSRIEKQYLRAQRMESIGTLAGGIAHDLNNVLAPILMAIELLKRGSRDPGDLEILTTVEASAKRGAEMVRQVLTFARGVEGHKIPLSPKHIFGDIQRIIHDTFPKSVTCEVRAPDSLWHIVGDPTQIHQVLVNLCVNSRDAMPNGGKIVISAENLVLDENYVKMNHEGKAGPHVLIKVTDNGSGIPADTIDKIFDPFYTTKDVGKGTGLGLSTALTIVKGHGGFINAYSEIGVGTTFRIYFPAAPDATSVVEENDTQPIPRGRGECILVVDDEEAVRLVTKQTLEAFGYRVILANNGVEAVSTYAEKKKEIAAVITDMMMPIMDGPITIYAIRNMNPNAKIIGASGLSANGDMAKSAAFGIKHFLPKPYMADAILRTVRQVLDEPSP